MTREEQKINGKKHRALYAESIKISKEKYKIKNREKLNEKTRKYRRNNPEKFLRDLAKARAIRRNLEFNLTLDDINIPKNCPVLGIPLFKMADKPGDNSPSIDRIDNSKGYIKGNVMVISRRANALKSDATLNELELIVDYIKRWSVQT